MVQTCLPRIQNPAQVSLYRLTPPGNNEWREARWPVPMPGEDAPLSSLAWCLLYKLRTTPTTSGDLVTASELFAAQEAVRVAHGAQNSRRWDVTRQRMRAVFEELLQHGYVEALDAPGPPRAAPPPYRLSAALDPGDPGLGLPSMARTFLTRLRAAPERVLTAADIGQAELLAGVLDAEAGSRMVRAAIAALVHAGYLVPVAPGEVQP